MMKKKLRLKQIDFAIVFIFILLAAISIVSISSATYTGDQVFYGKQIIWYLVGFLCMFCVLLFDYKILTQGRVLLLLYGFGILLNLLVMVPGIGEKVNGAQLWIRIGDFSIQPSELMKIFVILILAKIIAQKKGEAWQDLHTLGKILLIAGVPFIIILLQPDLGTALILLAIIASMLLAGGLDRKWLAGGFALVVLVVGAVLLLYISDSPLLHVLLADHQIERIQIFLDPASDPSGAGYQATQAKIAIGSGMLWGKGFHQGTQAQGNWIPEPHNDFIFAVIAEEFGFVGSSVLLLCYLFLLYRLIKNCPFGKQSVWCLYCQRSNRHVCFSDFPKRWYGHWLNAHYRNPVAFYQLWGYIDCNPAGRRRSGLECWHACKKRTTAIHNLLIGVSIVRLERSFIKNRKGADTIAPLIMLTD